MSAFEMYPTIITPYGEDGNIDFESLENLIRMFSQIGCEGIFAVCQSSEMFFLSEDEKLALARESIALCRKYGIKCVVSGHTQSDIEEEIRYLTSLEALHPDAVILVSNRLADQDESDDIALKHLERLLEALSPTTALGIYECPYPYKRLLTPRILDAMRESGRFSFIKDTCCHINDIKDRLALLKGSSIRLFNANMATLEESVSCGAAGYSGIMLNLQPELFRILHLAYAEGRSDQTKQILTFLSAASTIEYQNYPRSAKFIQMQRGLLKTVLTRTPNIELTESQKKELLAFDECTRAACKWFISSSST